MKEVLVSRNSLDYIDINILTKFTNNFRRYYKKTKAIVYSNDESVFDIVGAPGSQKYYELLIKLHFKNQRIADYKIKEEEVVQIIWLSIYEISSFMFNIYK